jgi:phage tail sheath protein FI
LSTEGGTDGTAPTEGAAFAAILSRLDGIDDAAILVGASERWVDSATKFTDTDSDGDIGDYFDALGGYAVNRPKQDLFLVGDVPAFSTATNPVTSARGFANTGVSATNFASLYWPQLVVADPVGATLNSTINVPASGALAGLYARIDARRGVWKAPAGVEATLGGIVRLQRDTTDSEQDDLNPVGVNVLRVIPGAGSVVWGSRTLQPASEWRYIPVRRTAMFLRKSIFNGIQFAVFEPNDTALWATLRATISAFMETQFRNGAFAGRTSRDAYFVKVDSDTTTDADQAAGIVNILVGFAPLRPAEFVVVKLSQKTASGA